MDRNSQKIKQGKFLNHWRIERENPGFCVELIAFTTNIAFNNRGILNATPTQLDVNYCKYIIPYIINDLMTVSNKWSMLITYNSVQALYTYIVVL